MHLNRVRVFCGPTDACSLDVMVTAKSGFAGLVVGNLVISQCRVSGAVTVQDGHEILDLERQILTHPPRNAVG